MIVSLTVENFLSYREKTVLSFIMSDDSDNESFTVQGSPTLLTSAVLIGANNSGKTNLILAIEYLRHMIGSDMPLSFRNKRRILDSPANDPNLPVIVELIFKNKDEELYSYGFSYETNNSAIINEWFLKKIQDRTITIFERNGSIIHSDVTSFDNIFKDNETIISSISNALMSPDLIKKLTSDTSKVFGYLDKARGAVIKQYGQDFLSEFETLHEEIHGIKSIYYERDIHGIIRINDEVIKRVEDDINYLTGRSFRLVLGGIKESDYEDLFTFVTDDGLKTEFKHEIYEIDEVRYQFSELSTGYQRLITILSVFYSELMYSNKKQLPCCIVIDEVYYSVDPCIINNLINRMLVMMKEYEVNAQMILTIHEPEVLVSDTFRNDEIWFVTKKDGISRIVSLHDYLDASRDNIKADYLDGRYHGIPNIKRRTA